jgi:hypothetical protein
VAMLQLLAAGECQRACDARQGEQHQRGCRGGHFEQHAHASQRQLQAARAVHRPGSSPPAGRARVCRRGRKCSVSAHARSQPGQSAADADTLTRARPLATSTESVSCHTEENLDTSMHSYRIGGERGKSQTVILGACAPRRLGLQASKWGHSPGAFPEGREWE